MLKNNLFIIIILIFLSGCGMLLKPDAIGKESTSNIDIPIAMLDSLGLVFLVAPGFAPGFIAIAGASLGAIISTTSLVIDYYNNTLFITKLQFSE